MSYICSRRNDWPVLQRREHMGRGGGRTHLLLAFLCHLTVDNASVSRRKYLYSMSNRCRSMRILCKLKLLAVTVEVEVATLGDNRIL